VAVLNKSLLLECTYLCAFVVVSQVSAFLEMPFYKHDMHITFQCRYCVSCLCYKHDAHLFVILLVDCDHIVQQKLVMGT